MKAVSTQRVDVLPSKERSIEINPIELDMNRENEYAVGLEWLVEGLELVSFDESSVTVVNNTNRTIMIFPGAELFDMEIVEEMEKTASVAGIQASPLEEETYAESGEKVYKCALCGKEYKSEGWLRRHYEEAHGTVI